MNKKVIYKICKQHFGDSFAKSICQINPFYGGMTNSSFYIKLNDGSEYLLRLPGKGTKKLINRVKETETYQTLKDLNLNISDEVAYIDAKTGIKLSKYMNCRSCDSTDVVDVKKCINTLKKLHNANIKKGRYFNLKDEILYYEKLMGKSKYENYNEVKERVFALLDIIEEMPKNICLCHIDPNPDNFCILDNDVKLVDWEYASLQDPLLDLAMFAIYSNYKENEIKYLLQIYFNQPFDILPKNIYKKVVMYCAIAGLLWSNWCEYKESLGINFGNYAKQQFYYANIFSADFLYDLKTVNNAIILAAGKGTRLNELTKDTHKALLKINNKPIIEYTIESLLEKEINNIYIAIGYKANDFEYLKQKYQNANIRFICIDKYDDTNNIYSLYCVLTNMSSTDSITTTVILDADQIIQSSAIRKYIKTSGYSTYFSAEHNNEWQPITNNKQIVDYIVNDKTKGQYIRSLSYWKTDDLYLLYKILMIEVKNKNTNIYWDEIPLRLYNSIFKLRTYNIKKNDIIEIDTINDYNEAKERLK